MQITPGLLRELAALAHLEFDAEQAERMKRDLDSILRYVAKLEELDTTDVPPTWHVLDVATPMRDDAVEGVLPVSEAVRNAPEHDDASMIVPKVIE